VVKWHLPSLSYPLPLAPMSCSTSCTCRPRFVWFPWHWSFMCPVWLLVPRPLLFTRVQLTALHVQLKLYLSGVLRCNFMFLICWKWHDMSVARTMSMTILRNSLKPESIDDGQLHLHTVTIRDYALRMAMAGGTQCVLTSSLAELATYCTL